jgi:hypothetical protein
MASADSENEICAAEAALYRAMIAKDIAALDKIIAEDVCYIHSPGFTEDKVAYLAGVKKGLYDYAAIMSHNVTIKVLGDAAIMHGLST